MRTLVFALAMLIVAGSATGCAQTPAPGPAADRSSGGLAPCPASPNCVCSTDPASPAAIAPLRYDPAGGEPMEALARAVTTLPGSHIVTRDGPYLHATITSRWLGFIDDLECLASPEDHAIHVRSASRLGYYDFGANRRRVEALRQAFEHPAR